MTDSELDDTHCDCVPKKTGIYEIVFPRPFSSLLFQSVCKYFVYINMLYIAHQVPYLWFEKSNKLSDLTD